jgi:hypothetical protein
VDKGVAPGTLFLFSLGLVGARSLDKLNRELPHQVRDESPPDRPSGAGAGRTLGAGCGWLWSCRGARRPLVRDCVWRRQRSYDDRGGTAFTVRL